MMVKINSNMIVKVIFEYLVNQIRGITLFHNRSTQVFDGKIINK